MLFSTAVTVPKSDLDVGDDLGERLCLMVTLRFFGSTQKHLHEMRECGVCTLEHFGGRMWGSSMIPGGRASRLARSGLCARPRGLLSSASQRDQWIVDLVICTPGDTGISALPRCERRCLSIREYASVLELISA